MRRSGEDGWTFTPEEAVELGRRALAREPRAVAAVHLIDRTLPVVKIAGEVGWPPRQVYRFRDDLAARGLAAVVAPRSPGRPRKYSQDQVLQAEAMLRARATGRRKVRIVTIHEETGIAPASIAKLRAAHAWRRLRRNARYRLKETPPVDVVGLFVTRGVLAIAASIPSRTWWFLDSDWPAEAPEPAAMRHLVDAIPRRPPGGRSRSSRAWWPRLLWFVGRVSRAIPPGTCLRFLCDSPRNCDSRIDLWNQHHPLARIERVAATSMGRAVRQLTAESGGSGCWSLAQEALRALRGAGDAGEVEWVAPAERIAAAWGARDIVAARRKIPWYRNYLIDPDRIHSPLDPRRYRD